jgi:hypothetical protein
VTSFSGRKRGGLNRKSGSVHPAINPAEKQLLNRIAAQKTTRWSRSCAAGRERFWVGDQFTLKVPFSVSECSNYERSGTNFVIIWHRGGNLS